MKKLLICIWIYFFACLVCAQDGKMVAVTAEQEVEIQNNDVAAARTIAISMATRAAVEKAYGTYVKVEELPDSRRIIAEASSRLKFSILAEQQRKNKYWVKIQAQVLVPTEYLTEDAAEERETLGEKMGTFLQKYPQGEINWGEGFILAYGKGQITEKSANAEEKAARAAEVDAKAHLLEMIHDIPVDDRTKLGQEPRLSFALEGFVRDSSVVARSKLGPTVQVTVQAPLRGVKGLAMTVYGTYIPEPPPKPQPPAEKPKPPQPPVTDKPKEPAKKPPVVEAETFTGVVLDARNVTANAALFPKVQDTRKKQVYGADKVNKDDLQKRGMASYAVVSRDVVISGMFPGALVIPVSFMTQGPTSGGGAARQGTKPLVLKSVDAAGELRTTVVISDDDALKLEVLDQNTNVLKEGRVVIVFAQEPAS